MERISGRRLLELRHHRNISQQQLAEDSGCSKRTIFRLEHDETSVDQVRLSGLARALHCPIAALREPVGAPLPAVIFRGKLALAGRRGFRKIED